MLANQYMILAPCTDSQVLRNKTTWSDPIPDVLFSIRNLAFRVAVQAPIDNPSIENATETVAYLGERVTTIYQTSFNIMGAGVLINFIGLSAVLAAYYGW